MEHCRRCLAEARLPNGPIDGLVDVFTRARFGDDPMSAADRTAAADFLADSIALLRAHDLHGDAEADPPAVAEALQVSR